MICLYLLIFSNENAIKTYENSYDVYNQYRIKQESNGKSPIFINQDPNADLKKWRYKIIDPQETVIAPSDISIIDRISMQKKLEENLDYFGEITPEEKNILKKQYSNIITEIDSLYNHYPTKNIIEDIIPWNEHYEEIELKSSLLYKENTVNPINISCTPYLYGYTDQLANELFKVKYWKDCPSFNNIINVTQTEITVNCSDAEYATGGIENNQELGMRDQQYNWKAVKDNTVSFNNNEFIFIKCRRSFKQAVRLNHFSEEASDRSKLIITKIERLLKFPMTKPIGIYLIMLDSVSRKHFYRNLPLTIDYLNSKLVNSTSDFLIYDFLINNNYDFHTTGNIIPILFGKHYESLLNITEKRIDKKNPKDNNAFKYIQDSSLLKYYERLGYVTAFDWDTMKDNYNNYVGKRIYADHTPLNFWSAAKKVFSYDDFASRRNCFGQYNHQMYVLDYLNQFHRNYKEHNRFGYFHISIGHEWSGVNIRSLDKDFLMFFEEFFNYHEKSDEDVILMVASDHGRGVSEWDLYLEGFMENELPVHMLIMNKKLMHRFGKETHENLLHNTQRLVSRADWHVTLKHLAVIPYGNLQTSSMIYEQFKIDSMSHNAVSLFLEKIPDNRTCNDVNIPIQYCSCRNYENIVSINIKQASLTIIQTTIDSINSWLNLQSECNSITIDKILSAESIILKKTKDSESFQVRVILTIAEYPNIRLEFFMYAADEETMKNIVKRKKLKTPKHIFTIDTKTIETKFMIQVTSIRILDEHICSYHNSYILFN